MSKEVKKKFLKNRRKERNYYNLKIHNKSNRLRISFFRSNKNINIQLIDDALGVTKLSVSTYNKKNLENMSFSDKAKQLAILFVEKCKEKNITKAIFDKGSYEYKKINKSFVDQLRSEGIII